MNKRSKCIISTQQLYETLESRLNNSTLPRSSSPSSSSQTAKGERPQRRAKARCPLVIAADRGYSEGLKGLVVRGMNGHVGRDEGGGEVHPAASLSHAAGFDVAPGEKERSEKEKQKSACGKNGEEKSADADADADADERESRGRSVLLKSNVSRCCAAGELDACTSSSASASRGIDSVGSINAGVARLLQLRRMVPLCSTHASELCALVKSLMATGAREQLRELGLAAPPPLRAPVPTLTSMQPRMLVRYIESVLAHLEYNYTGVSYFNIRKDRPLSQIMDTAKQILREQLPIKCVEAVFLSLYLTSRHRGIARIPVAFRTRVVGAKASSSGSNGPAPEYRHLVLILHNRQTNRFGALGTSRRRDLACKDFTYTSIGELLTEFRRSYARWMHRVVSITLGLPVQHLSQQHSSQSAASGAGERMPASTSAMAAMGTQFREHFPRSPVCWRYCRLDVSDSEDVDDNDGAGSTDDMMVMEGEEEEEAEEHEGGGGVDKTARGTSRAISGVTDVMDPAVDGENIRAMMGTSPFILLLLLQRGQRRKEIRLVLAMMRIIGRGYVPVPRNSLLLTAIGCSLNGHRRRCLRAVDRRLPRLQLRAWHARECVR